MRDLGFDFVSKSRNREKAVELMAEMAAEREEDFDPRKGTVEEEDFVDWWVENAEDMHKVLKNYQLKRTDSDFDDDEGLFGDDDDSLMGGGGSEKNRILSKYSRRGVTRRTSSSSKREYKFTFRVENNPSLF